MDHAISKLGADRSETGHLVSRKNEVRFELNVTALGLLGAKGGYTTDTVYFTDP